MSGLKYTPERAKQAAEQYAHLSSSKGSSGSNHGCLFYIVIFFFIFGLVVDFIKYCKRDIEFNEADEAAVLQQICDEIYTVSYDDLESIAFDGNVMFDVNRKKFTLRKKIEVYHQSLYDDIKEDVEYTTVIVFIGKKVNDFAAVPNEDGSFILEPMSDFRKRMHK